MEKGNMAKVSERKEGRGGGAPNIRAEILLQGLLKTIMQQIVSL